MSVISLESLAEAFAKKDAEIERFRAAYESSQSTVLKYWEQRESDHQLISELADAFSETFCALLLSTDVDYEGDSPEDSYEWKLILRAREATK